MKKFRFILFLLFIFMLSVESVNAESIFKPVSYYNDFEVDANYIIVAYDQEENSWYALSPYNESYAVKIDDPRNGIRLTDNEVKNSQYVLKCSKKDSSNQIKLRSNLVDEATGKKYSLYLNKEEVFNLGGGTITLGTRSVDGTGLVPIHMGKHKISSLAFDTITNSFKYLNNYYNDSVVYVFTDKEAMLVQDEAVKLAKINNLAQLDASFNTGDKYNRFQMVYKNSDGKSYILTDSGTKEITVNNNEINTKDYLYFFDNYNFSTAYAHGYASALGEKVINGKYLNYSDNEFVFSDEKPGAFYKYHYIYSCSEQSSQLCYLDSERTPFVGGSPSKEIFAMETKYYVSVDDGVYIGFDNINKKFVPVGDSSKAVFFDIYTEQELYDIKAVQYFKDSNTSSLVEYTASNILYGLGHHGYKPENCLGWSTDSNSLGLIDPLDAENLFTYNAKLKKRDINPEVKKKYSIIDNLSDVESNGEIINLYLVRYNYPNLQKQPYIGNIGNENIIGVDDWKNVQEQKTDEYLEKHEKNQGSIFIEVYLDDKLFIPAKKMYYSYENDNTTDITIKFFDPTISDLHSYLLEQGNYYDHPDYNIVGVYAEQGGSEEGLYKNFNWLTANGGQLDNVRGGSTVKIYLSSQYTLKYYLDDKLYEKDNFTYVPTITKDIISANTKKSDFVVNSIENADLLNMTDGVEFFRENNMFRGEYFSFSYELDGLNDVVTILDLPKEKLLKNYWIIKNNSNEMKYRAVPTELMKHEKIEGVDYIFIDDNDDMHTIHLYAYTVNEKVDIPNDLIKITYPGEFSNPETSSILTVIAVIIMVCLFSGIIVLKANRQVD